MGRTRQMSSAISPRLGRKQEVSRPHGPRRADWHAVATTAAAQPPTCRRPSRAIAPIPPAQWRKKLRRVWILRNCGTSISLFSANEFVKVEQDAAESDPVLLLVEVGGEPVLLARRGFAAK